MRFQLPLALALAVSAAAQIGPQPGEVYREYKRTMRDGSDWRVTDAATKQVRAHQHLPNSVLSIVIDDLEDAVRAEALIDRWGGHAGTLAKRIRFNENRWIFLPELETTPPGHAPERYQYQDNPIIEIPLADLKEGENVFEGASGAQIATGLDWGQWGWTGIVLRVYYDPARKPHVKGRVVSPTAGAVLGENPRVRVETEADDRVRRVDVLARYEGYDLDGNGVYLDWQRFYNHDRKGPDGPDEPAIQGHAGTATAAPFEVEWDTRLVPDQPSPVVGVLARIESEDGLWFVTEPVLGLRLSRESETVRLYKPEAVPEKYCPRAGVWIMSKFVVPSADRSLEPLDATLHLRTWHGAEKDFWVNGWNAPIHGGDHVYAYTVHDLPADVLRKGENRVEFHTDTLEHCVEVLWPGPGVTVRYAKPEDAGQ